MSNFVPDKYHLRSAMLFFYHQKKTAAEAQRLLHETYGKHTIGKSQCTAWFRRFKNGDFDVHNKDRGRPTKKFEDNDLQALLDEDNSQTQQQLAMRLEVSRVSVSLRLKAMGKMLKLGKWVHRELSERQQEKRKTTCEMLLTRHNRKPFLQRIVNGGEKWIYVENRKRKAPTDSSPSDQLGQRAMLCVWWDQEGVLYYELLKPGETVTTQRYREQLIALEQAVGEKRALLQEGSQNIILVHCNVASHTGPAVADTIGQFKWENLLHEDYLSDLSPCYYYFFPALESAFSNQRIGSFDSVLEWLDGWFDSKDSSFFRRGIQQLPERWTKCIATDGRYFD